MQYKKVNYKTKDKFYKRINWKKVLFLAPRILAIAYILFLAIFSFLSMNNQEIGVIIKLIPSLLLAIILIFTWKKPVAGGVIFLILGIAFTFIFSTARTTLTFVLVSLPPILVGILLLLSKILKRE